MGSARFQAQIVERTAAAGVNLDPELTDRLEHYWSLLTMWNRRINLTGFPLESSSPEGIDRLLVEPLVAVRHLPEGARIVVDVGSGGGSPAIPMALASPALSLTMVEVRTRKAVFLREAVRALKLRFARVVNARVEDLSWRRPLHGSVDLITVRAVKLEEATVAAISELLKPHGYLFLFGSGAATVRGFRELGTYPLPGDSQLTVLQEGST